MSRFSARWFISAKAAEELEAAQKEAGEGEQPRALSV